MEAHDIMARIDALETRCPKLGHEVPFGYCRREAGALPCPRALACWSHRFSVELVLRTILGPVAFEAAFGAEPKSRVQNLMEAIEAAKARCASAPQDGS
ncbi:hypothetical protein [Desulfosoma sp.]|uniref:Uncharacterized protein n=1 Tax=Desulfacinum infernum TaxID=35837 RepID=A0A832EJY9_9BACT